MTRFADQFDLLHTMAIEATGLEDFGDTDYHEPLRLILADIDEYNVLSDIGVELTQQNLMVLLAGRLMTQQGIKSAPEVLEASVERPLVVTGFPRTGTTVLQRLLDADPQFQSLPFWLAKMPMPRPPRDTWEKHPVYQEIANGLSELSALSPDFLKLHPIRPESADECRWSIDQSFWTTTTAGTLTLPNYTRWLVEADPTSAYAYHKRVLQLVGSGDDRRWRLKDPSHLFALETLVDQFPGACIVYTHRDPLDCISSVANLVWSFRPLTEPELTKEEAGTQMIEFWAASAKKAEESRARLDEQSFFDIHVEETRTDPVGTAERIYAHFDISIPDSTRQAWQDAVASPVTLAHKSTKQDPEQFGLTRERVADALGDYMERYEAISKR